MTVRILAHKSFKVDELKLKVLSTVSINDQCGMVVVQKMANHW